MNQKLPNIKVYRHCSWLKAGVNSEKKREVVDMLTRYLKPHRNKFNAIAVVGFSGTSIGSVLAYNLDKDLIYIRKEGEKSHGYLAEGVTNVKYIFLDDLISSGATLGFALNKMKNIFPTNELVGLVMYQGFDYIKNGEEEAINKFTNHITFGPKKMEQILAKYGIEVK